MVLNLVVIAIAIAIDPLPITAWIVVLPSRRGVIKGAAFLFGWLVSLAIVVAITIAATGDKPPRPATAPSLAALAVKMAIGAVLIIIGTRHWRRMGEPKKPKKPPKWQAGVDNMSPWFAMALAPAVQPWGLIAAGAATVTGAKLSSAGSFVALIVFCLLASSTYLGTEIYAALRPAQIQAFLGKIRAAIDAHMDQVIIFGSLALGLWLLFDSLYLVLA